MSYPAEIAHGIMFHHFHNERHYKGGGSISKEDFERILHFVGLKRIIEPNEWIKRINAGQLRAEDICITFDDGLLSQFEIALPVLEKYRIKAFWFVYSDVFEGHLNKLEIYRFFRYNFFNSIDDFYDLFFTRVSSLKFRDRIRTIVNETNIADYLKRYPFYSINDIKFRLVRRALSEEEYETIMDEIIKERGISLTKISKNLWMSNDHLKELTKRGHLVGLHSCSHPMAMSDLSFKEQWQEYNLNYNHLNRVCGKPPIAMAHPANSYNNNTLQILKRLGIQCGFRSDMLPPKGKQLNPSRYEIARDDHANIIRIIK